MSRWVRLIYPAEFARRHADEIAALLETSPQPVRDHLDVAIHAVRLRSEHLMSHVPRHLAGVALATAMFLLGFVVNDLEHGLGEIARHWWSAAAVLLVVIACSARAAVRVVDEHRTNRSDSTPP